MEVELKLALERPEDLPRLLASLPEPESVVDQHNHYFTDDAGKTAEAKVMVRVRREQRLDRRELDRVTLTLKRRTRTEAGVFTSEEREHEVPAEFYDDLVAGRRDLLELPGDETEWLRQELGLERLREHALMVNRRHRVPLSGFLLEVDETRFPDGTVEAEVEVETDHPNEAREVVFEVARGAGVALRDQTLGKYSRLMQRLRPRA